MSARTYGGASSGGETGSLSDHVATRRAQLGWSLAEVAARTGLSRAYVNAVERGRSTRPSVDTVRRFEAALGPLEATDEQEIDVPPGLAAIADELGLPQNEVSSLARLHVRGRRPQSKQRWAFIYQALLASESMDAE